MAREDNSDWGKIIGNIIWWIIKLIWKIFLMVLWGFLRLTEVIAGQFAKWVKTNV